MFWIWIIKSPKHPNGNMTPTFCRENNEETSVLDLGGEPPWHDRKNPRSQVGFPGYGTGLGLESSLGRDWLGLNNPYPQARHWSGLELGSTEVKGMERNHWANLTDLLLVCTYWLPCTIMTQSIPSACHALHFWSQNLWKSVNIAWLKSTEEIDSKNGTTKIILPGEIGQ